MKTAETKFLESMYAGIYGDILGSVYEFKDASRIPKNLTIPQILSNKTNVFGNPVGTYTDDTILMLCAMASFNEVGNFDKDNQMKWISSYISNGTFSPTGKCFDIGNATLASCNEWNSGKVCDKTKRQGNGVLMRLAPYAYWCLVRGLEPLEFARMVTTLTHSDYCIETTNKLMYILMEYYKGNIPLYAEDGNNFDPNGYHKSSLNIAIRSVETDVETTILNAISYGGDTDTNACISGFIAGAMYGFDINKVQLAETEKQTIQTFLNLCKQN